MLLIGSSLSILVLVGYLVLPYLLPPPDISRPLDPEGMDPAVAALVTPMMEAVEASPRAPMLRATLGMAYEANALWPEARQSFANAAKLEKGKMAWHLHHAMATREVGEIPEALELLKDTAVRFPGAAAAYHRLAEALVEQGDLEGAYSAYKRVVKLVPRLPQGYVGLSDILLQRGDVDGAIQMAEAALEVQPGYRHAEYVLEQAYRQSGRTLQASLSHAASVAPRVEYVPDPITNKVLTFVVNVTDRISMAQALLDQGRPKAAAELLEETYLYHPNHLMLVNTLAVAYMRTKRPADAERLLKQALRMDESAFYTHLNLYQLALRQTEIDKALMHADKAIECAPDRDDTHLARAQAVCGCCPFYQARVPICLVGLTGERFGQS